MPERQIKARSFRAVVRTCACFFRIRTINHAITSTTAVRIAVARLDSTPVIPILARIEVSAAKTADRMA